MANNLTKEQLTSIIDNIISNLRCSVYSISDMFVGIDYSTYAFTQFDVLSDIKTIREHKGKPWEAPIPHPDPYTRAFSAPNHETRIKARAKRNRRKKSK